MNQLGRFIEQKRRGLGMSLRDFADLCCISHSYLDSIEKGVDARSGKPISPTIETLQKMALGLKMPLIDLLRVCGYIDSSGNSEIISEFSDDELMQFIKEISPKLSLEDKRDLKEIIKIFVRKSGQKKK